MTVSMNEYIETPLDRDLDSMLSQLWKKKPQPTEKYLEFRAKLLIVQELRGIKALLIQSSKEQEPQK